MTGFTVLTVCTGNIHRSALAHELLATWAQWYLPADLRRDVTVGSAGTGAAVGAPMGVTTWRIARSLGAEDGSHRARAVTDRLIAEADLVLAASRAHRDEIVRRDPRALRRSFTIREAGRIAALAAPEHPHSPDDLRAVVARMADRRADAAPHSRSDDDIVDPQGRDVSAYDAMVREEVPPLVRLAVVLFGMPRADADEYLRVAGAPALLR